MRPERVIRGDRVVDNAWTFVGVDSAEELTQLLPTGPVAVPLAHWHAARGSLLARAEPVAVWLEPGDDPLALDGEVLHLPLIGVRFPKFADGRGYSTAVLLRTRLGYRGELLAFGELGRDQLFHLRRCGFDAVSLGPHRDLEAALASLEDFSVRYQGSVDDPTPLFRKRLAATRAAP